MFSHFQLKTYLHNSVYLMLSDGLFPARRDKMVDFPDPCSPRTPTTKKSVWSSNTCNRSARHCSYGQINNNIAIGNGAVKPEDT